MDPVGKLHHALQWLVWSVIYKWAEPSETLRLRCFEIARTCMKHIIDLTLFKRSVPLKKQNWLSSTGSCQTGSCQKKVCRQIELHYLNFSCTSIEASESHQIQPSVRFALWDNHHIMIKYQIIAILNDQQWTTLPDCWKTGHTSKR